ncbi:Cys-tRNA(Pro)/Cys-tRNA(Cys) deacylase [Metabacillus malikii]|uniref:Cys-tRNA(Pro)/Cys-tRNA(Cys) deacylase n=1 Tax=Metabacillus malikii TaxID=1504265 RepID=A0ABT9ZEQ7_9BACI|nr:Cys-tRNA(Pro)/Cys-tRNA(Cys) deacylase [Metabacillus malikii]
MKIVSRKTNAMRILDAENIQYAVLNYNSNDGRIDGIAVADKVNRPAAQVYKTLVTIGQNKIYVFVIPVTEELDLKKAAKCANEKKLEMLAVKDLQKWTGYIRGGCSPLGMKKSFPTYLHVSANELDKIIISGGKIGVQIEMQPNDLIKVINGQLVELVK